MGSRRVRRRIDRGSPPTPEPRMAVARSRGADAPDTPWRHRRRPWLGGWRRRADRDSLDTLRSRRLGTPDLAGGAGRCVGADAGGTRVAAEHPAGVRTAPVEPDVAGFATGAIAVSRARGRRDTTGCSRSGRDRNRLPVVTHD